jgi:hypothetical protein
MHIGSQVWIFDGNRRIYREGQSGPVYREHFVAHTVIGGTRSSWLLSGGFKVDKRTGLLRKPLGGWYAVRPQVYTLSQVNDDCYVNTERHRIADLVARIRDANVLRKVEAVLRDAYGEVWR